MIHGKKRIFLFILCILNIFLVFKIFDDESGLPVYKDLKLKIESVQEKINDVELHNRQISSEIRILKKNDRYVERLIKRELFYVADNELMYIMK
ncbi:MAG: septum formation initiator family protein [Desulfomicrobium sp.]|jgi:cell division protein FtsB|nr:septum formation initiator family protein [Pseudomonadota bacterium]MBV1713202.1 septum formation initiator family protein [Desulfomicrobium sp.]MBU4571306.1 septum formation initiator family protein [Pseudomonadota bacterium]MBU4595568.1 septum formation initiator family protein [Pseudomonadota bacterium]MBV1720010.1 septum formation initiator family protein [Desulfomicrobium sp.]